MKKILAAAAAIVFFAGIGFAGDKGTINISAGFDAVSNMSIEMYGDDASFGRKAGFNVSAEYMHPINDMIKIGGGLQYLLPRKATMKMGPEIDIKTSVLPIYVSVQANPFKEVSGLFLKGNLGYNVLVDVDVKYGGHDMDVDSKGGIYAGLGCGFEFQNGFFFDVMYGYYAGKAEPDAAPSMDANISMVSLNIGYKFAL